MKYDKLIFKKIICYTLVFILSSLLMTGFVSLMNIANTLCFSIGVLGGVLTITIVALYVKNECVKLFRWLSEENKSE